MALTDRVSALATRTAQEFKDVRAAIAARRGTIIYDGGPIVAGTVFTSVLPDGMVSADRQWTLDDSDIPGETGETYSAAEDAGDKRLGCRLTNPVYAADGIELPAFESATITIPNFPNLSAGINARRAGTGHARILCIGDSTTAGHSAGRAGMGGHNRAASWPSFLASRINRRGHDVAGLNSIMGSANAADGRLYYNNVHFPAGLGWGYATDTGTSGRTLGGYTTRQQGVAPTKVSRFRLRFGTAVNRVDFFNPRTGASAASAWIPTWDDDAEGAAFSNYHSPGQLEVVTQNAAALKRQFGVRAATTDATFFSGFIGVNDNNKEISVINAGASGAKIADLILNDVDWSPLNTIADVNPDLVVINVGINDYNQAAPTPQATFEAGLTTLVNAAKAAGADVLLVIPNPIGGTYAANGNTYATYITNVATATSVPLLDLRSYFVNYATANAAGFMADNLHPNMLGYDGIALMIANVIYPASIFTEYTGTSLFKYTAANDPAGTKIVAQKSEAGGHFVRLGEGADPASGADIDAQLPLVSSTGTLYFPQTNAQGGQNFASSVIPDADCEVVLKLKVLSNPATAPLTGIYARANATGTVMCHARYNSSGAWELVVFNAGSTVIGAAIPAALTVGQIYTLRLRCVGTTVEFYVDDVLIASTTTASVTSRGLAGIRQWASTTAPANDNSQHQIVEFEVRKAS